MLAREGTTVFLHDWNRPAEKQFAERYLKAPDEQYGKRPTLAVFDYRAICSDECSGHIGQKPAPLERA
jgi:hypothetical protein